MEKFIIRVNKYDSIESIENKYLCPKHIIFKLNKIEYVYEGQWLYIEKSATRIYIVKPFDTINSICAQFNVDEKEILEYNEIEDIFVGMKLFI